MGRGVRGVMDQLHRRGMVDVTAHLYPGARHEVFNEINREGVTDDLIVWLDQRVGTSGQS
jgi:alpha-beta hydrolase superfamily lysophospholipase